MFKTLNDATLHFYFGNIIVFSAPLQNHSLSWLKGLIGMKVVISFFSIFNAYKLFFIAI